MPWVIVCSPQYYQSFILAVSKGLAGSHGWETFRASTHNPHGDYSTASGNSINASSPDGGTKATAEMASSVSRRCTLTPVALRD
ncbi:MAG: hypothetical protein RLZZ568_630 [Cyanobacteriota bacterium]